jgi:hypothetical protein
MHEERITESREYGISDATFYKWRSRMGGWKCPTRASSDRLTTRTAGLTNTCSSTSKRHVRSSKHGGSITTQTDHTRASTGSHQPSLQHAPQPRAKLEQTLLMNEGNLGSRSGAGRVVYSCSPTNKGVLW